MTLVIPPGWSQVAWRWELNGDPEYIWTTCGLHTTALGGDFQAMCDRASAAMLAAWPAAGMSNQWRYRGCVLRVGQDGSPPIIFETVANVAGAGGANILPQNCAVLIRKLTGSAGRRNRGRFYMPMLSVIETAVDQVGAIDAAAVTDLQTRANLLYSGLATGSPPIQPAILHSDGGVTPTPAPTLVTGFAVEPKIATQRRRMRR